MLEGFAARELPEGCRMSKDSAEKRQAFERWVSTLRTHPDGSPVTVGEDSGVLSLDDQKTLVQHLPKDVVRRLREREATRNLSVDPDSTAIFDAPPELLARARRLAPPKKPERSGAPSTPAEPLPEPLPTPLVEALPPEEVVLPEQLRQPPLPTLSADELEELPPEAPFPPEPEAAFHAELAPEPRRASSFGWTLVVLGAGLSAGYAWFVLTH
jgi:hypothetical protein